jgi:hypothetical protein
MKGKILIFCLFVFAMAMVVFAVKPDDAGLQAATAGQGANAETATAAKNMTFGQCVSEAAVVKNTCYAGVKTTDTTCKGAVNQSAEKQAMKQALKDCKAAYKANKKQCKVDFKATKKNECGIIKHNFLESIGVMFK